MKITKLEHACLDITAGSGRLIIDPGHFTQPLKDYSGINAVVITHVHQDHLDESKIHKIAGQNPSLVIFCPQQVAAKLSEDLRITVPAIGTDYEAGGFTLKFYGGQHALIMDGMPQDENLGVLVNGLLYYPGDSLTPCADPHAVTAAPSIAPWLKLDEAAAFIKQDSAQQIFLTHNAIASDIGNDMLASMLKGVAEQSGKTFQDLKPGESIEV